MQRDIVRNARLDKRTPSARLAGKHAAILFDSMNQQTDLELLEAFNIEYQHTTKKGYQTYVDLWEVRFPKSGNVAQYTGKNMERNSERVNKLAAAYAELGPQEISPFGD